MKTEIPDESIRRKGHEVSLTHVVCIGNSDGKLTPLEWHQFHSAVKELVQAYSKSTYFIGYTPPNVIWQSAAFVFEPWDGDENLFKTRLAAILGTYRQDSAALVVGDTQFVDGVPAIREITGEICGK